MIEVSFKDINTFNNKIPRIEIVLNEQVIYRGIVEEYITVSKFLWKASLGGSAETNNVRIYFTNKTDKDTQVNEHKDIVNDLNFTLEKIAIDGVDVEHLIWESNYVTDNETIPSCLFFGPKGYFDFNFKLPILKWFLKTNNDKNNKDPHWEQDYELYIRTLAWHKENRAV